MTQEQLEDRALRQWARGEGYASIDDYFAAGGTRAEARRSLEHQRAQPNLALQALARYEPPQPEPGNGHAEIGPDALARLEAEQAGEHHGHPPEVPIQGYEE